MIKLLHFATPITLTNFGAHDPETGLPERVMDFCNLGTIIQTAIDERSIWSSLLAMPTKISPAHLSTR